MAIIWVIKGTPITNPDGTVTPGNDQNAYVDHLIQNNKYVNCLNYGSTLAWEELYGTYTRGTLPNGVSYLNCKRTSKDPSVTAGYLSDGDLLYNDDVLTYEYDAEDYWTVTATTTSQTLKTSTTMVPDASVSPRTRETALEGVTATGITSSAHMYSIQFGNSFPSSSSTVTFSYYDNTGTKQTKVYNDGGTSASMILLPCWCGGEVSWTPSTTASYWTTHLGYYLAGTQTKGTIVSPSSFFTRNMRTITVTKNTGVASISVTYTNSSGTRTTASYTSSASISAWQGATVTWTATASSGYTMSSSSGTIAIGTSGATISPTATLASRTITYPKVTGATVGQLTYTNTSGSMQTSDLYARYAAVSTSVKNGTSATWKAFPNAGYFLASSGSASTQVTRTEGYLTGTIPAGSSDVTIGFTATAQSKAWRSYTEGSSFSKAFTSAQLTAGTALSLKTFGYIRAFTNMRVTGSVSVVGSNGTTYTGSFSNIAISANQTSVSYTDVCTVALAEVAAFGLADSVKFSVAKNLSNQLVVKPTLTSMTGVTYTATFKITSLQVYVYPAASSTTGYADFKPIAPEVTSDGVLLTIRNRNTIPVTVVFKGSIEFDESEEGGRYGWSSTTFSTNLGTTTLITIPAQDVASAQLKPSVTMVGSSDFDSSASEDQSIYACDLEIAFATSDYYYISDSVLFSW